MKKTTFSGLALFSGIAALFCGFHYFRWGVVGGDPGCVRTRESGDFNSISAALRMFRANNGQYPTTSQGLAAVVDKPTVGPATPRWTKLMDKVPLDRWKKEYLYVHLSEVKGEVPFEIRSAGADGVFYTDDDISSLED